MTLSPKVSVRDIVFRIFLQPIWEKKTHFVFFIISLILLASSQSLFLFLLGPFLKTMFSLESTASIVHGADFLSPRLQTLLPQLSVMAFAKTTLIYAVPGLLLFAALLKNLSTYVYQLTSAYFGLLVAKRYRDQLFTAILNQPFREIVQRSPAEWMSALMNDVMYLQNKFSDIVNSLVRDSIMILAAFGTLLFIHWPTALSLMIVAPILGSGVGRIGKTIAQYTSAVQKKLAELADLIHDSRRRFEFIKAHRAEVYERNRFDSVNRDYYRTIRKSIFIRSIFAPFLEFISFAILALILILIGKGILAEHFSASDMIVFLAALGAIMAPLRRIGEQLTQFHETRGALGKSLDLLQALKHEKETIQKSSSETSSTHRFDIQTLRAGIDHSVKLEAHDLTITPGQAIAVIGPSGGGKSTLIKTLSGLLKPIEWDASHSIDELSSQSSLVSQVPFLFDDTLLNNLNYGLQDPLHAADLDAYFRIVGIDEELSRFSEGLETPIKALSSNISGGQKQRLVLVRSLLRKKPVLLLDEATSSVDPSMEEQILDRLLMWARANTKSVIAVTHRLNILDRFDEIWFVENGKLSARGTLEQLMSQKRFQIYYNASL